MFYQDEDTMLKHRGTIEFFAPECFKPKGSTTTQYYSGRAADVWALGMTIYTMTYNELPFKVGLGVDQVIQDLEIDFDKRKVSLNLKSFLEQMLNKNAAARAKIDELETHMFLND